jgi:hypothetical protein
MPTGMLNREEFREPRRSWAIFVKRMPKKVNTVGSWVAPLPIVKENSRNGQIRSALMTPVIVSRADFQYLAFRDTKGKL